MEETLISFETAVLAKEKGLDLITIFFYTKPNSKMFGIDEKGRAHHIKNTAKKIYRCGEEVTLNIENVYRAPTQSLLQKWLRETYKINVEVTDYSGAGFFKFEIFNLRDWNKVNLLPIDWLENDEYHKNHNTSSIFTYEEALEEGLYQALLLSPDKK